MMMRRLLLAFAVLALSAAPMAGYAHGPNPNGSCDNVEDEAELTVLPTELGTGLVIAYVDTEPNGEDSPESPGVYTEGNGAPGLQTHDHVCTDKTTFEIKSFPADPRLV